MSKRPRSTGPFNVKHAYSDCFHIEANGEMDLVGTAFGEANAKLLAAAPELEEALLEVVRDLVTSEIIDDILCEEKGLPPLPRHPSIEKARKVLAKLV